MKKIISVIISILLIASVVAGIGFRHPENALVQAYSKSFFPEEKVHEFIYPVSVDVEKEYFLREVCVALHLPYDGASEFYYENKDIINECLDLKAVYTYAHDFFYINNPTDFKEYLELMLKGRSESHSTLAYTSSIGAGHNTVYNYFSVVYDHDGNDLYVPYDAEKLYLGYKDTAYSAELVPVTDKLYHESLAEWENYIDKYIAGRNLPSSILMNLFGSLDWKGWCNSYVEMAYGYGYFLMNDRTVRSPADCKADFIKYAGKEAYDKGVELVRKYMNISKVDGKYVQYIDGWEDWPVVTDNGGFDILMSKKADINGEYERMKRRVGLKNAIGSHFTDWYNFDMANDDLSSWVSLPEVGKERVEIRRLEYDHCVPEEWRQACVFITLAQIYAFSSSVLWSDEEVRDLWNFTISKAKEYGYFSNDYKVPSMPALPESFKASTYLCQDRPWLTDNYGDVFVYKDRTGWSISGTCGDAMFESDAEWINAIYDLIPCTNWDCTPNGLPAALIKDGIQVDRMRIENTYEPLFNSYLYYIKTLDGRYEYFYPKKQVVFDATRGTYKTYPLGKAPVVTWSTDCGATGYTFAHTLYRKAESGTGLLDAVAAITDRDMIHLYPSYNGEKNGSYYIVDKEYARDSVLKNRKPVTFNLNYSRL